MPFAASGIAQLNRLAAKGNLVTTDDCRALFGISVQRWQRMTRQPGFPERTREGREYVVDPRLMAAYLTLANAIAAGMTLSQAGRLTKHSNKTIRALVDRGRFPPPIGHRRGGPIFARADVEAWQRAQRNGLVPVARPIAVPRVANAGQNRR